jgi:hypothetical protein
VEAQPIDHGLAPRFGLDAAVEFAPDWAALPPRRRFSPGWRGLALLGLTEDAYLRHEIRDYERLAERMITKPEPRYLRYPCVTPAWDNTARRQSGALIFQGSTPERYGRWLREILRRFQPPSSEENLVFINAWNEWAEGNHLEPDQCWGRAYLEATRRELQRADGGQ